MELSIEKWLSEQLFNRESVTLFQESIACYKAGAYRAGLLFSYLGSQSVIKNRILEADCPDEVAEFFWNDVNIGLLNEDVWESAVWNALISKKHGEIFKIGNGHLKKQLEYWRGIRNDCAHAKDNEIIAAHVESYWAFLRSNMPKLVVSGGKDSIINRIHRHFDIGYTPSNSDPAPIINDMAVGVNEEDLVEVFEELNQITKDHIDYIFTFEDSSEPASFWEGIIKLDGTTSKKCIEFLKSNPDGILYHILDFYPNLVTYLSDDPEFIRNMWHEKIGELTSPFEVLASLLDHDCIPQEQTAEAILVVIRKSRDTELIPLTLQRLDNYGFSRMFQEEVFTGLGRRISSFDWANSHLSLVCSFLKQRVLNSEVVVHISEAFRVSNHAFKLRDSLYKLFNEERNLKIEFTRIAEKEEIELPERLGF